MKAKNKIIISFSLIFLSIFGVIICSSSSKNNVQQNQPNNLHLKEEKKENKSQNNLDKIFKDEDLTSYFAIFLVSEIVFYFFVQFLLKKIFLKYNDYYVNRHQKEIWYLAFIKMVLEMMAIDNSLRAQKGYLYKKKLTFDPMDFLNKFLFNQQNNYLERAKALEITNYYRKLFISARSVTAFFFINLPLIYLLTFITNLLFNFFFHGKKTWKRLKWNSLWMLIPNMKYKYERIISYGNFLTLIGLFYYRKSKPEVDDYCQFGNDLSGRYWLLESIVFLFLERLRRTGKFTREQFNENFSYLKRANISKNKQNIIHHNLDENNLQQIDKNVDEYLGAFHTEVAKKFLIQMKNVIKITDEAEMKMLEEIFSFAEIKLEN